jgi:hypothetical protein
MSFSACGSEAIPIFDPNAAGINQPTTGCIAWRGRDAQHA